MFAATPSKTNEKETTEEVTVHKQTIFSTPGPSIKVNDAETSNFEPSLSQPDDLKSDDEFHTASECTLRHSISPSNFDSASECESSYAPWWDQDKITNENICKEKMVLAVGCPQLPHPSEVLKPSPEIPAGKIVHEVIETTHIRVEHSHKLGVKSFVLSSETVRDKRSEGSAWTQEVVEVIGTEKKEDVEEDDGGLLDKIKECGSWLQLKILEITPELTKLGATLTEAVELQKAHNEVLQQLQNKQSPVEELLRQADQLISTQKPRAEVYAAMAETLGRAWRDINFNLDLRRQILDLNVQYHTRADEFFDKIKTLEDSCKDTVVPVEIQAVKDFLTNIHELRRSLLEALMGALQAGNALLGKLKEMGAEGTLESRPDHIRQSVDKALSQVQSWLDELHLRRQDVEATFNRRKLQLEQCLALAMLAADLRQLQETVISCRNRLANACQLGDSTSSAELLQHENGKFVPEAQLLQEKALKITKATEQLLASGCFAGEEATKQSYAVLALASDYLTEVQNRSVLLERAVNFFKSAQSAFNKLDQLDIQLSTTHSQQLHSHCSQILQEITDGPIIEGHAILDAVSGISQGAEGVKRTVEELENVKIRIATRIEENSKVNEALEEFFSRYEELSRWLGGVAEAFSRGHRDMGGDLDSSKEFMDLHHKLLSDLQDKGNEINSLLMILPPIMDYLSDERRKDVDTKVEQLHNKWMELKGLLENRLDLGRIYVKFHTEADIVNREIDKLEDELRSQGGNVDDEVLKDLEIRWESLEPLYQSAKNTGLTFVNDARKVVNEPHLDANRAVACVDVVLQKLSGRQLQVTKRWQSYHAEVVEQKELLVKLEETMVESTRTINWVTKLEAQLYPIITCDPTILDPKLIASFIENKLETILPDIKKAQNEVEKKIRTADALLAKTNTRDEKSLNVKNKLAELNQKLKEIANDYQNLLQILISYFRSLDEINEKTREVNENSTELFRVDEVSKVRSKINAHMTSVQNVLRMVDFAQNDCEKIVQRILNQEPPSAADHDIEKLKHNLQLTKVNLEEIFGKQRDNLEKHITFCQFDEDLKSINLSISRLEQQNQELKDRHGKSLEEAKTASLAYESFENTIQELNGRIEKFIEYGNTLIIQQQPQSSLIEMHIQELQDRWHEFLNHVLLTRGLINLSIQYFQLVNEADNWFKEGSRLLVSIARRSTLVKKPQEAEELLSEIAIFLKPGEEEQNRRIQKIAELAEQIYGSQQPKQVNQVISENNEMMKSFSIVREELDTLTKNLIRAEEEREHMKREQELAAAKLAAARAEAIAAEQARLAAEEEKRKAEEAAKKAELEALERRRQAEEAARLAELEALERQRQAEMERRAAEEAARKAELEALERQRQAEEAMKKAELEALEKQRQAEIERKIREEAAKKAEIEALERQRLAEEAAKKAELEALEKQRLAEIEIRAKAEAAAKAELEALERQRLAEEAARKAEIEAMETRRKAEIEKQAREEAIEKERLERQRVAAEAERKAEIEAMKKAELQAIQTQGNGETVIERNRVESVTHVLQVDTVSSAPSFTVPLRDTVIEEGSKFSFECQVRGHPTPSVTWFKDGIAIENNPDYQTQYHNGICTLTIEETFGDDSAKYTCKAANSVGVAETNAILSVQETEPEEHLIPPSFAKLLEPAFVKEGTQFEFKCKVEGNPLPNVQWYKNQECIDFAAGYHITYNNGDAVLKFERLELKDKAEYTCKATNQAGSAQSTASLSVTPLIPAQPPSIITPLSNVMARTGQKLKLECEISGKPLPETAWYQNGHLLKETRELKLQREGDRSTLVIYEAFPKDAGNYQVIAINLAGEAKTSCSVSVKGRLPNETSDSEVASDMEPVKPSIQLPLTDISIDEGSRVRLDCVIIGQPEPEVIWYHDSRPVKESSDFQLLFQGDRCSLVIQEALAEDGGEYKVVALNSAGEASSRCNLTIKPSSGSAKEEEKVIPVGFPPKFNKLLADVLVSEGDKVVFEGNVVGQPKPEIKWLLNNLPVNVDDHIEVSHDEDGNIKLEIKKVRPQDKGVYTVKAANNHGEAKCFAQLIVKSSKVPETIKYEEIKSAPVFTERFSDKIAFENTPTKFECIVSGKPKPRVKWLFRGEPIIGNNNLLVSTSGDRQVLSIPSISKETEGSITCVAENESGSSSCSANLTVHSLATITLPESGGIEKFDSNFSIRREIHTESSTTMSSKVMSSFGEKLEPETKIHSFSSHDQKTFRQMNQQPPEISESHNVEEYLKLGNDQPIIHEKSSSTFSTKDDKSSSFPTVQQVIQVQKPKISRAPKFVTPVMGKIVDQDVDIILEGIIDGQPTPKVNWTKNGKEVIDGGKLKTKWELNKASLEIKNVNSGDAGRYTCTAVNEAGTAISTADLVVRKTIFPPVFGRRLQAQVIKKGDRIVMEVEVTGTPEPTVTWFKDSTPIEQALKENFRVKTMGNSHTLIIEKADLKHSGRFMVRAVNSGGEAQSIADMAVFEPTPDTMVEVVKTVVFEDVRKHETLTSAADQISSVVPPPIQPSSTSFPEIQKPSLITSNIEPHSRIFESSSIDSRANTQYSTFSEQQVSQQIKTARLEYTAPEIPHPKPLRLEPLEKQTDFEIVGEPPQLDLKEGSIEEGIQTSSITKESSLQFFVKKIEESKESDKEASPPKRIIESYKRFESKPQQVEKEIPINIESRPLPQAPLLPKLELDTHESKSSSSRDISQEFFELKPEPPAQICYSEQKTSVLDPKADSIEISIQQQSSNAFLDKHEQFPPTKYQMLNEKQFQEEQSFNSTRQIFETSSISEYEQRSSVVPPRPEAMEMKKIWSDKQEKHTTSFQPTIQVKEMITETPRIHYVANVSHCIEPCEKKLEDVYSKFEKTEERSKFVSESIVEENNVKPSQVAKSWPPYQEAVPVFIASPTKPLPTFATLPTSQVSVQDITHEVILEPGSPPIIDYAHPPKARRQSYVETVEQELESKLETIPAKVPPGGVRTIPPPPSARIAPPPLPPKREQPLAPPIPAKPRMETPKKIIVIEASPSEKFPELEPFPFVPEPERPKSVGRFGPPPTPSKFIKGRFTDSDYESDFESHRIPAKWKPCNSDTEDPTFRKVKAPKLDEFKRSRSTDPEPLPPTKFDQPPVFQGPPRPEIKLEQQQSKKQYVQKFQKLENLGFSESIIKPGSPPLYIEAPQKKPESPKVKKRVTLDGYMADTDEPFFQSRQEKMESHEVGSNFRRYECKSENLIESSRKFVSAGVVPQKVFHPKKIVSSEKKELTSTPIITSISTQEHNESYEKQTKFEQKSYLQEQTKPVKIKCQPPPSPSKFVRGEFKESDYESDYDRPIQKIWRPGSAGDYVQNYKSVRPTLASPLVVRGVQSVVTPTPPTEFEQPAKSFGAPRPKFEPIDKPLGKTAPKTVVFKPKPMQPSGQSSEVTKFISLRPGTPPEMAFATPPQTTQIYKSTTSMPYHNAIQTETSNIVHFKESNEQCHRTMSVEQSTKVIKFGDQNVEARRMRAPPVTTPKKFVPGEFRESDYESDVENIRIRARWAPSGSDTEDLHYRPVRPPSSASRSSSVPPSRERVLTPMEFDKSPAYLPSNDVTDGEMRKFQTNSLSRSFLRSRSQDAASRRVDNLRPGSPPEYAMALTDSNFKTKATKMATQHMDSMTKEFKSKTQSFVKHIMKDVEHQQSGPKSILKNAEENREAQVYREETRAAQHGTKHIDPDTGLIYFKYDFGYEFGIVLPGESKNGGIPIPPKTVIEPPKRTTDIVMPVYHETTKKTVKNTSDNQKNLLRVQNGSVNKNIKWEPTSESELSEYEGNKGPMRWEPSSCSPVSLSPSLPGTSPIAFNSSFAGSEKHRVDTPPSCPTTPVNAQRGPSGQIKAPMFITPLRNIAVISGQNAKFECIVQSEPIPSVLWSKNGRIIEDSNDYQIHFRNGVCRLTISKAYPEDAGTYTCTATNHAGSASTTAILDVPGEIRSLYIK